MTATIAELMRKIADATDQMRDLDKTKCRSNTENGTTHRTGSKLVNTLQTNRQTQTMSALTYDTRRDSEVMKAITVVTLIFLPATFVSVRPDPVPGIPAHLLSRRSSLQHGFLHY